MVLTIVGLGLTDIEDVSLKGLKAVKEADIVYLDIYTSFLIESDKDQLEKFYGKKIHEADRMCIEEQNEVFLKEAVNKKVAILVAGDPLSATTHSELCLSAMEHGIDVKIIHNASIINAVGASGLQLYRFGETVSIPFFDDGWSPDSFFDKIFRNYNSNLHTLCLLDIKVRERSVDNLMLNRPVFEPPRFMTVNTAVEQILSISRRRNQNMEDILGIGIARLGAKTEKMVSGKLADLASIDFGGPLHSLIVCAPNLHEVEEKYLHHLWGDR